MAEKKYNSEFRRYIWSKLVKLAKREKKCYYGDVVHNIYKKYVIRLPNEIGYLLGPIMNYCQDHKMPPLTSLIVNKRQGIPGKGLSTCKISSKEELRKVHKRVFAYKWGKFPNPFKKSY